jgi:hypothetical protein
VKILVDESLPRYVKHMVREHQVFTVQEMGWGGLKNGPLLARLEGVFDVFLTADKNLRYQQNLKERRVAIVIFPSNKLSVVKQLEASLHSVLAGIVSGSFVEL